MDWVYKKIDDHVREVFTPEREYKLDERINILFVFDDCVS